MDFVTQKLGKLGITLHVIAFWFRIHPGTQVLMSVTLKCIYYPWASIHTMVISLVE